MWKKGMVFILLLLLIAGVGKSWHFAKGGFAIARIRPFYLQLYGSALPSEEVKQQLRQTYRYLGRGRQCYAFASADGKYVLKLPRFDHFRVPFWLRAFPFKDRKSACAVDKQKRHQFILNSFQLAEEELQEETGIVYLHLGESAWFQKRATLVDRVGRKFSLDLDQTAFVLQKKQPQLMMPVLLSHLQKGESEAAKRILDAFFAVIAIRAEKGIFNKDPTFFKNFGYDGERVVQIDIGSFYRKEASAEVSFQETVRQFREETGIQ